MTLEASGRARPSAALRAKRTFVEALARNDFAAVRREAAAILNSASADAEGAALLLEAADALQAIGALQPAGRAFLAARRIADCPVRAWFTAAALQHDLGRPEQSRRSLEMGLRRLGPQAAPLGPVLDFARQSWPPKPTPAETAEVFMFTHVSAKLRINKALSMPGTGLIESTLESFQTALDARNAPVTVLFDKRDTETDHAYEAALSAVCAGRGARLLVRSEQRLRRQWMTAIRESRADLVFFLEHDWAFLPGSPTLAELMSIFRTAPDVNYIRLNKRENIARGVDLYVLAGERPELSGLSRIPSFSNNPHLIRRTALLGLIQPLLETTQKDDTQNKGAGAVEHTILDAYKQAVATLGAAFSLRLFGTFLHGAPGSGARIAHTGV